jgi:hypothetical protein
MELVGNRTLRFAARQVRSLVPLLHEVEDPRHASWVERPLPEVVSALFLGAVANQPTLRDVEEQTHSLRPWARSVVPKPISDTTMYTLAARLEPEALRPLLLRQIHALNRTRALVPSRTPISLGVVDGKVLAVTDHDADGWGQAHHDPDTGEVTHHLVRALRCVLASADATPTIDQMPVEPDRNDMSTGERFVTRLIETWGRFRLFEALSFDAGFCSEHTAWVVDHHDLGYVFALKEGQPELLAEARRLLLPKLAAGVEAQSRERYKGNWMVREVVRTSDIAGYHDWAHLRQAWLVRQTCVDDLGRVLRCEERFFLTNLPAGRLDGKGVLAVVRAHWRIENESNWPLDVQWREDHGRWCTTGASAYVLGLLRLLACNLVMHLRLRHFRPPWAGDNWSPPAWRKLFRAIERALISDWTPDLTATPD